MPFAFQDNPIEKRLLAIAVSFGILEKAFIHYSVLTDEPGVAVHDFVSELANLDEVLVHHQPANSTDVTSLVHLAMVLAEFVILHLDL